MSFTNTAGELWRQHRRRLSFVVAIVGILVVGGQLFEAFPRETEIRYRLGPAHEEVDQLTVEYLTEGELFHGASFDWPAGAPASHRHTVDLVPGRYEIRAILTGPSSRQQYRRVLDVPAEGVVQVDLFDTAIAAASLGEAR